VVVKGQLNHNMELKLLFLTLLYVLQCYTAPTGITANSTTSTTIKIPTTDTNAPTVKATTTKAPIIVVPTKPPQYIQCSDAFNKCENEGTCFYDVSNQKNTFCRCADNYNGKLCQNKSTDNYKNAMYGVVFIAVLLFAVSVFTVCQLYVRKGDIQDAKREKMELEVYYKKKINKSNLSSAANSDTTSIYAGGERELYKITPTGIVRSGSDSISLDKLESVAINVNGRTGEDKTRDVEDEVYSTDEDSDVDFVRKRRDIDDETQSISSLNSLSMLVIPSQQRRPNSWCGTVDHALEKELDDMVKNVENTDSGLEASATSLGKKVINQKGYYADPTDIQNNGPIKPEVNKNRLSPAQLRKHNARSLQDLRVLAMNSNVPKAKSEFSYGAPKQQKPIVNMHTGQIAKATSTDDIAIHKQVRQHKAKPKGMWARQQEREQNDRN